MSLLFILHLLLRVLLTVTVATSPGRHGRRGQGTRTSIPATTTNDKPQALSFSFSRLPSPSSFSFQQEYIKLPFVVCIGIVGYETHTTYDGGTTFIIILIGKRSFILRQRHRPRLGTTRVRDRGHDSRHGRCGTKHTTRR